MAEVFVVFEEVYSDYEPEGYTSYFREIFSTEEKAKQFIKNRIVEEYNAKGDLVYLYEFVENIQSISLDDIVEDEPVTYMSRMSRYEVEYYSYIFYRSKV